MRINIRELPYQTGTVSLEGTTYKITIKWNETTAKWYLDLSGIIEDVDIKGVAMLVGRDLLEPYGYGITLGRLEIVDNSEANEDPAYTGFGDRWTLEYSELL